MDSSPLTILLVERDDARAAPLRAVLRAASSGGRLLEAPDVNAGIALARSEEVNVLLLGNDGGSGDGSQVVRVRELAPEFPIVFISESEDDPAATVARDGGAEEVLPRSELEQALLSRALRYAVDRHRMQRTLRELSLVDPLTRLYNWTGFVTLAEHHLKLARRTRGLLLGFFVIDSLLTTLERAGREAHSAVVGRTANFLRLVFRGSDVIARVGDGEFAVLMVDAGPSSLPIVERRVLEQARDAGSWIDTPRPLRVGAAISPLTDFASMEPLLVELARLRAGRRPIADLRG